MKHSKSSAQWLQEHRNDPFVKKAKAEGYRARSFFKLEEIDKKYHLLKSGMIVVDLGAAPGGWSQYAVKRLGRAGRMLALDILEMSPIPQVEFILGDCTDQKIIDSLAQLLADQKVDVVLSDMAPNMSGIKGVDQIQSVRLAEIAFDFAKAHLKPGGSFLVKVFHGLGQEQFLFRCRKWFSKVYVCKPEASRARSSEVYLYAKDFLNREK